MALKINGIDIKAQYGAYLIDKSYEQLLVYPELGNVMSNDWYEDDGLEVDLGSSTLTARKFSVTYGVSGTGRWNDFQQFLKSSWVHNMEIPDLGLTFTLRFTGVGSFETDADGTLTKIRVSYSDDQLDCYLGGTAKPQKAVYPDGGCTFRGENVGLYGIKILSGVADLRKQDSPKNPLVRAIGSRSGAITDTGSTITLGNKTIVLRGIWRASSAGEFATAYKSFIRVLFTGTTTRMEYDGTKYAVIYSRLTFSEVSIGADGSIWALFQLQLVNVGSLNVSYWYDFDLMVLGATYNLEEDIRYVVKDGYLYDKG